MDGAFTFAYLPNNGISINMGFYRSMALGDLGSEALTVLMSGAN